MMFICPGGILRNLKIIGSGGWNPQRDLQFLERQNPNWNQNSLLHKYAWLRQGKVLCACISIDLVAFRLNGSGKNQWVTPFPGAFCFLTDTLGKRVTTHVLHPTVEEITGRTFEVCVLYLSVSSLCQCILFNMSKGILDFVSSLHNMSSITLVTTLLIHFTINVVKYNQQIKYDTWWSCPVV